MEVAPRYELLTLLKLFSLFTLLTLLTWRTLLTGRGEAMVAEGA